ncbi:MAG TPA: methyltransferase domain-containing protein [Terriglobales bacterium]|nr:methyltransferase domain-containing protein [Terriglobales bacterium]
MTARPSSEPVQVGQHPPTDLFFEKQAPRWPNRYLSRTYLQRRNLVLSTVVEELSTRRVDRSAEYRALDFGCGAGVFVGALSALGIRVTGVDRSRAMIEAAQSRLGSSCTAELELIRDDPGNDAAYRRHSYDLVLCLSVLEFVADHAEIIAHLAALLAPGGLLILTVPNRNSYLRRLERFAFDHPSVHRWIPGLNHLALPDCYLRYQRQQFTAEELVHSTKGLGLEVEQHRFHVAPSLCAPIERFEKVGMMILLSFRKRIRTG